MPESHASDATSIPAAPETQVAATIQASSKQIKSSPYLHFYLPALKMASGIIQPHAKEAHIVNTSTGIRLLLTLIIVGILGIVSIQVLIATPLLSTRLLFAPPPWINWLIGILFSIGILTTLFIGRQKLTYLFDRTENLSKKPSTAMWLGSVITIGIILRLLWVISFPASPSSDGATYLWLAEKLSRGEEYGGTGWRAFWPPGYPFLLSPIVAIFGSSKEVIVGTNLAIYTGTIIGVYFLGRTIRGEACGRIATAIICIWPTHIALTGVPEKEMPLILILVIVFLLLYRRPKNYKIALPAGMILGFGALVQPSVILLPTAVIVSDFLIRSPAKIILMRLALILLGMALIISPWSIRNYQVFDQFVLISTNGGGVFYKANHPEATGGFIRTQWTDQLDQYPELEANALGFKLGMEWIRENPMDFLRLAIEKQILFLGDDSTGIYETLRRGGIQVSEPTYAAWKAVANSYWILIWIIILVGTYRWLSRREPPSTLLLPMILVFLYFYSIHSIVESGGKYHLPALGFLAIIAALSITEKQRSHRQSQQRP